MPKAGISSKDFCSFENSQNDAILWQRGKYVKFSKAQLLGCLIAGPALGFLVNREPWRMWYDPIGDALGGIIVLAICIVIAKLIKKGWDAVFKRREGPSI